jgi:hypothetical protein
MRIPEQQLVSIAATYMEDPARQWFDSLDNTPNTWKKTKVVSLRMSPEKLSSMNTSKSIHAKSQSPLGGLTT